VQAAYQVDDLALIGSAIVAIATGAALHGVAGVATARPLLTALLAIDGILLVALVAVTDAVGATLVAGAAAATAVAIALFVAPATAAARLAALLAFGVQSFIAAALLLALFGTATFDLGRVPPAAVGPEVLAAMTLGATFFCGLYPFVPWRYERRELESLAAVRGVALFPIGVAGSVLALRLVVATRTPSTDLLLPGIALEWHATLLVVALGLTALAVRTAPRDARLRRAVTGATFFVVLAALPSLGWSHVVALLALLTVMYAGVASAAVTEEWEVARFDVRLAVLWAAIASGSPLALVGALFGLLASGTALLLEVAPLRSQARDISRASAGVLGAIGPFIALVGLSTTPDPGVAVLCGAVLGSAAVLELAHAVRSTAAVSSDRRFVAVAAVAVTAVAVVVASAPVVRAAAGAFPSTRADWTDLVLPGIGLLAAALAVVVVAAPGVVSIRVDPRLVAGVRRVLAATDPVPGLALTYRGLEAWSGRIGAAFAALEDRAGVWVATLLIALTLIWAAGS
jgi:hypothetical protein